MYLIYNIDKIHTLISYNLKSGFLRPHGAFKAYKTNQDSKQIAITQKGYSKQIFIFRIENIHRW